MDLSFLSSTKLFSGISEEELKKMLPCLKGRRKHYKKGATVFHAGDVIKEIGLVERGSVNIVMTFYWGDAQIFGHVSKGGIFAETYAAIPGKELAVDVVAAESSTICFFDIQKVATVCQSGCPFHNRLVHNLLRLSAQKNLNLSSRMMHTAPKTIRERLLSYLSEQAVMHNSASFSIPFSRQELADYLGVDRSALSNELSKMRRDGLIRCRKNSFTLLD